MSRPKVALYWCAGCGGCEESVVDLGPALLDWLEQVEVVFWPLVMDFKRADLERCDDGELAVAFVNGAVRTDEDRAMLRLLRRKARLVVAHGSCAQLGGVVGLGNLHPTRALLDRVFPGAGPPRPPTRLCERAAPLDAAVSVDYVIPGCPPTPELVGQALNALLDDRPPPPGTVFGEPRALCASCPRQASLPQGQPLGALRRVQERVWDPALCFLAEGLVCLGPATRGGCGARCIGANAPCRGCFGPAPGCTDQGACGMSFLATLLDPASPDVARQALDELPDPVGLFYRYGLAASLLPGREQPEDGEGGDDGA